MAAKIVSSYMVRNEQWFFCLSVCNSLFEDYLKFLKASNKFFLL